MFYERIAKSDMFFVCLVKCVGISFANIRFSLTCLTEGLCKMTVKMSVYVTTRPIAVHPPIHGPINDWEFRL